MPKTIAIIGTRGYPSYYGGFETAVRKLAPYLVDAGFSVRVYGRRGATKTNDAHQDSRVKTIVTPGIDGKFLSTLSYGFSAVLHAFFNKPDVALVMNVANGFWLPILKLRGIRTVVNVDGIEWERAKWSRLGQAVFKSGARLTARFADTLIADSTEIQRRWKADFGRDSVFIPYGGDLYSAKAVEPGLKQREYVLVVARLVPENSIPEFFEAVPKIARKHKVIIVGSSGHGGDLDKIAAELDATFPSVHWLRHVSDDGRLAALWQHAGLYFHGHSVGGTNPALVQAMAVGAPTLARRTAYNMEVLPATAPFVSADPAEIAEAILERMDNRAWMEMARVENMTRASEFYSWDDVCAKYAACIEGAKH